MQLFAYSLLWTLILPVASVVLLIRILFKYRGYSSKRLNRLSIFADNIASTDIVWHCVSVGEVVAITPLINALLAEQPALKITITTTTPTGAAQVEKSLKDSVQHCFIPYDHPLLMRRFLQRLDPSLVLVTEVEVWPNLISQCTKRSVPTMLVNARMTERSANRYAKLGGFFANTVRQFSSICTQSQQDAERYITLGASRDTVIVAGNLKFAIQPQSSSDPFVEALLAQSQAQNKSVLVAASTHAPEELMILEQHRYLVSNEINVISVIVPRHPQRFDDVISIVRESNLHYHLYSSGTSIPADTDVVIVDAMGVMHALLHIADLAFVGGSFADRGGHNALEPALYGVPVIMGPSQYNNPAITNALQSAGALVTANTQSELQTQACKWLSDANVRHQAGEAGLDVIRANQGAMAHHMKQILTRLS